MRALLLPVGSHCIHIVPLFMERIVSRNPTCYRSSFDSTYRDTAKLVIQPVCCTHVRHTGFCILDSVLCGHSGI